MALTDDFSYRLGDTGFILNPDDTTPPFIDITKVDGLDNAPYRTTERDHEGTDGGFMDAEYEKGRPLSLEGMAYAEHVGVTQLLDQLKGEWAPSRVLVPFYYKEPGVPERVLFVKPLGCRYDVDQARRVGTTAIQFQMFAEDPRIYTANLQEANIVQSVTVEGGRAYNRGYDYGYGDPALDAADTYTLVNGGNRPTPPLFTIFGPAVNPRIINDTLGIQMIFTIVLDAGESLVINPQYKTVRFNGVANRRSVLMSPNWFFLRPGENVLRYRSDVLLGSTLNVQWRDAWR
jgi:hypothetical protein